MGDNIGVTITNSYATGAVSGSGSTKTSAGGLVGLNQGTITNSYFDSTTTRLSAGIGEDRNSQSVTALNTAGLQGLRSAPNWSTNNWDFGNTSQYPALRSYKENTEGNQIQGDLICGQPAPRAGCPGVSEPVVEEPDVDIPDGFTGISTIEDLNNIRNNLAGSYALTGDIDLSGIESWTPIGENYANKFTGNFDGQGYEIRGLNSSGHQHASLFGYVDGASISNLGVVAGNISASSSSGLISAGGLVGRAISSSQISNCYVEVTGNISASSSSSVSVYAGGLVGDAGNTSISGSYVIVAGDISSTSSAPPLDSSPTYAGGLVGYINSGSISNSYAEVMGDTSSTSSTSFSYAGGLVGDAETSQISNSYADFVGNISSSSGGFSSAYAGGLVGDASGSQISNSYVDFAGSISSTSPKSGAYAGGLAGYMISSGSISNSYAVVTGDISGIEAGGLVGNIIGSPISHSYVMVTGDISGSSYAGGLVGQTNSGNLISNSYYSASRKSSENSGVFSNFRGISRTVVQLHALTAEGYWLDSVL